MKANQKLRDFTNDDNAAVGMIITGAMILMLSIIIVPVFFRTAASTDSKAVDEAINTNVYGYSAGGDPDDDENSTWVSWNTSKPAGNATNTIIDIGSSVMGLNPLAALVAVAGGIIGILLAVLSPRMFAGAGL